MWGEGGWGPGSDLGPGPLSTVLCLSSRREVGRKGWDTGGPGQGTMYLGIQVDGGASSSYGGWKPRVLTEGWGIAGSQLNPFWLVLRMHHI